jgi:hypothetical protein
VEVKVEGIMCLHPRAEDFQDRSPWKVEETTEGLPLFDPREVK